LQNAIYISLDAVMRRGVLILTILAILVAALGYLFFWPRMTSHINERFTTQNDQFRIRVTAHAETASFVPGAYYVFESAPTGSDHWHRITVFRHDDPVPIPRDQIRFVSARTGCIFMGWIYAVTTGRQLVCLVGAEGFAGLVQLCIDP